MELNSSIDHFTGVSEQFNSRGRQVQVTALICYEALFASDIRATIPRDTSGLIINITNDSWFSSSFARKFHLPMARMRSIETSRYLVRSSLDGITMAFDNHGDAVKPALDAEKPGYQLVKVRALSSQTLYVRFAEKPVVSLLLLLSLVLMIDFIKNRKSWS